MNNSVFSRLNFIDAIIILTSAKLIFRPILANISIKLPNPLTIKQYDFNHLLKLKPRKQNPKPKPDPICLDLPDDILLTILSKVDIVTLRRCTLALSQDDILPQIVSFSTPLQASLFLPDKSRCWYGRLFNKIISNSVVLFLMCLGSDSVIPETVIKLTADVFLWINMPVLKPEAVDFLKKLTGLRSLEIELPTTMPCYDCRVSPHLWFKFDARVGVYDNVASYGVYVFGDKADVSEGYAFKRLSLILRATKTVAYHTMLHCSLMDLGFEGGMRITTKDAGRNAGSMMMGPQSGWDDGDKARFKILHLPSTLKFNCYANDEEEDAVQVQDVVLMFVVFVDDASDDRDDNDIIMACLADMDGEEEAAANQRTELRQIVTEIITDENCKVILDSHSATQ